MSSFLVRVARRHACGRHGREIRRDTTSVINQWIPLGPFLSTTTTFLGTSLVCAFEIGEVFCAITLVLELLAPSDQTVSFSFFRLLLVGGGHTTYAFRVCWARFCFCFACPRSADKAGSFGGGGPLWCCCVLV